MKTTLTTKLATAAAAAGLALAAVVGVAGPAGAADTGSTTATFTITGGTLDIVVPASTVALATGDISAGDVLASAQPGAVSVTDTRGALLGNWTTGVSSTDFVTGGATANEKVAASAIAYSSGAAATTGTGAFTVGLLTTLEPTAPRGTAGSYVGEGNNSATWNPTLTFTLGAQQVVGTYTGTVTHSVA